MTNLSFYYIRFKFGRVDYLLCYISEEFSDLENGGLDELAIVLEMVLILGVLSILGGVD